MATPNGTDGSTASEPVDILLIGLGSIGSIYAYLLERSGKARVTAVARSNYTLYRTTGVTLYTDRFGVIEGWKPYKVVKSQKEALENGQKYPICIVCTKCLPDVLPNSELLKDAIESGQIGSWNLIQNGLGIEEELYQAVKHLNTPIMTSPCWIGIVTEGDVVRWRGKDTLVTGLYPPLPTKGSSENRVFSERENEALNLWVDLLTAGEGYVHTTDHIDSVRYLKNVWNAAWAVVTGLIRHTPLQFSYLSKPEENMIKAYFKEVVDVGFEAGLLYEGMIQYPSGNIMGDRQSLIDSTWTILTEMARERGVGHRYSLLIDIETNKPFEIEVIVGSVMRIAQEHHIDTPRLEFAYAMLKALQLEIIRSNEKEKVEKVVEVGA
ncbi:uncharacterized protein IL334_001072 [Kwoniella shivajii]|uniref:2-dehydropantoate 2-reductase n=1 Tax=Kwoniella shivajii TaxID=564305 RepID=A0ABZ1CR33_9TREE|nr:hypothetical protein IL334_001072 [Kwoniella shivajii]